MVDVIQQGLSTSEAPQTRVGGDAFSAGPPRNNALAQGMAGLAEGVDAVAVRAAKDQAQADVEASVTRNPDGSIHVEQPATRFMFGNAGPVYEHALVAGVSALGTTEVESKLAAIRQKNINDPAQFQKDAGDYLDSARANMPGPIGAQMFADGSRVAAGHFRSLTNLQFDQTTKRQEQGLTTNLNNAQNDAINLARAGVMSGKDWDATQSRFEGSLRDLGANPAFNWSPEKVASSRTLFGQQLQGEMLAGSMDRLYPTKGYLGAQKELDETINGPKLDHLSQEMKASLRSAGQQRLEYLRTQDVARITANTAGIDALWEKAQQPGSVIADEQWLAARDSANALKDPTGLAKLDAAQRVYMNARSGRGLPPDAQARAVMGSPTGGAVFDPTKTDGYLETTRRIENPKGDPRAVSPTGASGDFQFTRGTAAQYGVTDRFDPVQSREGARQLAIDNASYLTKALGRQPTEAEVYLAHQQGAAGAAALLRNPNVNAVQALAPAFGGDLAKADQAIRVNGGTPSMTAGQFAAKWTGRYAQIATGAQPSINGQPYTREEMAKNPFIIAGAVRQMANDDAARKEFTTQLGTAIEGQLSKHILPNRDDAASYVQLASAIPSEAPRLQRIMAGYTGATQANSDFTTMGPQAATNYANDVLQRAQGGSIYQSQIATAYRDHIEAKSQQLQKDPPGAAVAAGWIPRRPAPLDFNNPQNLAQGMAERGHMATVVGTNMRDQSQSAVAPNEVDQFKSIMANGTIEQRVNALGAVASPALTEPVRKATLAHLGSDAQTRILAVAGSIAREAPDVARNLLLGDQLLKGEPKLGPDDKEGGPAIVKALPFHDFPNDKMRDAMTGGIKAMYAKLSADANDVSGKLNGDRLTAAINAVTGGTIRFRGSTIVAPWRGADENKFDEALRSITADDLRGAITTDGSPFPAAALQSRSLGTGGNWRLQSIADGKYVIFSGDDQNRRTVQTDKFDARDPGGAFVLDLGSKRGEIERMPMRPAQRLPPSGLAPLPDFGVPDASRAPTSAPLGKGPLPVSTEIGS